MAAIAKKLLLLYYEPQRSGQTAHVLSLAQGLDVTRWHVAVVLPDHLVDAAAQFRSLGVQVEPIPMRKLEWNPSTLFALVRRMRAEQYDIVHVHSQEAGLWARIVARLAGMPAIIYTPQTTDIRRGRFFWLYAWIERTLARITDAIVSVNKADRERLVGWGIPAEKVGVIANGIDLTRFGGSVDARGMRQSLRLDSSLPLVMQVGRLSEQKDPVAFVRGASEVIAAGHQAHFMLVGDGPLRREVEVCVRDLGMDGWVQLLGWRDDAYRLIAAVDVVTLSSRWEGAPYALLEAMAWSKPVVATAVNGCPEIVADGISGFLVPHGDTKAWAARVAELLASPIRAGEMGRQGRTRAEREFPLTRMLSSIEELYSRFTPA